ncbi:MAG: radical SAM protein [Parcubacteria group bacterium]|nr:radical SAM protein [Parcubacteria group bacterium]
MSKTKIIKIQAKSIFTQSKLSGAKWVLNPYVGCEHNCLYCYARFINRWRPSNYGKWGTWVEVKINAPELVKDKYVDGLVLMSSICDAYQPIEKELKLTRKILENIDKRVKLTILTKSYLVLRDIDLLKQFKDVEIGFTINSFTNKAKKLFEPDSPTNNKRIEVLKTLKKQGFKTYTFVSPIIPELIDLKDIISKTKDYSDYYWFEFINVRGAGKQFSETLKKEFPESYKIITDKENLQKFVEDSKKIINSYKIKVKGIEIH